MDRTDKLITIAFISLSAFVSLLILPETTAHIDADHTAVAAAIAPAYFDDVSIDAKAAYVYDLTNNKVIYEKNSSQNLPLASLTKIMTAVTASELAPANTTVTIDMDSLALSGDNGLYADERWDLTKLLQFMLVVSSNDAASAIARSLGALGHPNDTQNAQSYFVDAMNKKAVSMGLNSLQFKNPSGLDESATEAGAYGSAEDVAHLLAYAVKNHQSILEPTRYSHFDTTSLDGFPHSAPNTDTIINQIPSLIGGKTGYTELAGGNLAVIFDAGIQHPIAIVVLGSTYEGRFTDMKKLVETSLKTINQQ